MSNALDSADDLSALLARADQIRDEMEVMQERLARLEFQGRSKAGGVSATLDNQGVLLKVDLAQALVDGGDRVLIEQQLVEAHAAARDRMLAVTAGEMNRLASRWLKPQDG